MDKKDINTVQDLSDWVWEHIQGCFPPTDMKVHKREVEKLKPGDVYLEVGVSQGLSFTNAEHFSKDGVFVMGIDIYDPVHRAEYMQGKSELIREGKKNFYMHADSNQAAELFKKFKQPFIKLLFIDGLHDYESVKLDTLNWEKLVVPGGTIMFHDYIQVDAVQTWVDEHYGKKVKVDQNIAIIRK